MVLSEGEGCRFRYSTYKFSINIWLVFQTQCIKKNAFLESYANIYQNFHISLQFSKKSTTRFWHSAWHFTFLFILYLLPLRYYIPLLPFQNLLVLCLKNFLRWEFIYMPPHPFLHRMTNKQHSVVIIKQ